MKLAPRKRVLFICMRYKNCIIVYEETNDVHGSCDVNLTTDSIYEAGHKMSRRTDVSRPEPLCIDSE